MSRQEFSELHRLLAILIYECNKTLLCDTLSDEYRNETIENIKALERIMNIIYLDGEIE
jgi:hypothetical protein